MRDRESAGFTLIELLLVVGIAAVLATISLVQLRAGMRRYTLTSATQTVAAAVRAARYQSVAKNRTLRLRFNCPEPGQFRLVEFVNDPAIDQAVDRCSETAYPFPDVNAANSPNFDGPVQRLPQGALFGLLSDLQIDHTGRMLRLTGCPACATAAAPATVIVGNGDENRTITISGSGQVSLQ
jgi:prepilin-type N-terminal cleavage/methylation domain-containing protein